MENFPAPPVRRDAQVSALILSPIAEPSKQVSNQNQESLAREQRELEGRVQTRLRPALNRRRPLVRRGRSMRAILGPTRGATWGKT